MSSVRSVDARAAYDDIGREYARHRCPDPLITAMVAALLGEARSIVNVGAGTGSYEPIGRDVLAIEPSLVMIHQRAPDAAPVIQATAEQLPLRSTSFDAALAMLTIHHWADPSAGLAEMVRVARRQIVLTFDPALHCTHWLTDYVPQLADIFGSAPPVEAVADAIAATMVQTVPLAHDTPDGMTIAYWRRPRAYLDAELRGGGSALQLVDADALDRGLGRLESDLDSGAWEQRYGHLLAMDSMDYGLRLISN